MCDASRDFAAVAIWHMLWNVINIGGAAVSRAARGSGQHADDNCGVRRRVDRRLEKAIATGKSLCMKRSHPELQAACVRQP